MKKHITWLAATLALASFVACTKTGSDPTPDPKPGPEPSTDTLFFKASVPVSKSTMDADGNMSWQSTDVVKFFDGTTTVTASPENISGATAEFTVVGLNPEATRFYAAYPADMVNTFETDGDIVFNSYGTDKQTLDKSYCAVAACPKSDEMTMSFRNVSYILRVKRPASGACSDASSVTFMTLERTPVSSGVKVTLADGDTPEISNVTSGSGTCATASANFDSNGIAVLNIDPLTTTEGFVLVPCDNSGTAMGIQLYRKSHTFESGSYYPWNLEPQLKPTPPDPVPPIDNLIFADGNLYYDNGTWGIEEMQYDFRTWAGYPCCIGGIYSATASGTAATNNIGLFYWTPDKDKSRAKDFVGDWTATAMSTNDFFANNVISEWRGMTKAELESICNTRTKANALRARATIMGTGLAQGITGVILLPDNFGDNPGFTLTDGQWIFPYGYTLKTAMSSPTGGSFADNTMTKYQWAILQYLGAVFLPAAGRAGAEHIYIGESLGSLYYWTSYYYQQSGDEHKAYYAVGKDLLPGEGTYGNCAQAFAVRLVKSAN